MNVRTYSGTTHFGTGRKTWSSVVPAPKLFGAPRMMPDLPFSKHGVILARTTSPSAKCVNPLRTSAQALRSNEIGSPNLAVTNRMGENPTSALSAISLRGAVSPSSSRQVQHQLSGNGKGGAG